VRTIERFADAETLQQAAAKRIVDLLREAIAQRRKGTIALSGGSTPKAIYELLAEEPFRSHVDWSRVHFFWGDERCVPPTHADSNYRMTNIALLEKIEIPDANIHRVEAERAPNEAARLYEGELRKCFSLKQNEFPRFDVLLLGIGEDGHTASLFPETAILNKTKRSVAEVFVPKFNAYRISMTFPTINNSRTILFLVSGASKTKILQEVLEGAPNRFPAQRIQPTSGKLFWFVDDTAATQLTEGRA
jgi:6-phosphogluconolactonase